MRAPRSPEDGYRFSVVLGGLRLSRCAVRAFYRVGDRVVYVERGVPHHATVLEVYRACCLIRLRANGLALTVPFLMLRRCPIALAYCREGKGAA